MTDSPNYPSESAGIAPRSLEVLEVPVEHVVHGSGVHRFVLSFSGLR